MAHFAGRPAFDSLIIFPVPCSTPFFTGQVIPLAKKLKDCGVFGVSSDEMLNFAVSNRQEWVEKGQQISRRMAEKYSFMMDVYDPKSSRQVERRSAQQ